MRIAKNCLPTVLLWIPGVIHAMLIVSEHKANKRSDKMAYRIAQYPYGNTPIAHVARLIGLVAFLSPTLCSTPSHLRFSRVNDLLRASDPSARTTLNASL